MNTPANEEEYYAVPTVPYEDGDELIHTDEHLFCEDMLCPCHEDQSNLTTVNAWVTDGLMTSNEADLYYRGSTL